MKNAPYKYSTLQENVAIATTAVAGLGVYTAGLLITFNPWVVAGVGLYVGYYLTKNIAMSVPFLREMMMKPYIQKGEYTKLGTDEYISQISKAISQEMGFKKAPDIYTITRDVVIRISFPLGLRWLGKLQKEMIDKTAMPKVFTAAPGKNMLMTTHQALNQNLPKTYLKFVTAHEMGHLKTDTFNLGTYGKTIIKKATEALVGVSLIVMGGSLLGVALPLMSAASIWWSLPAAIVWATLGKIGVMAASRISERRADRNALYFTRDLDSAKKTMDWIHSHEPVKFKTESEMTEEKEIRWGAYIDYGAPQPPKEKSGIISELIASHPSYHRRVEALRKSFNIVSQYPAPQAVAKDNTLIILSSCYTHPTNRGGGRG